MAGLAPDEYEPQPPSDQAAEQSVIGSILVDPDVLPQVMNTINAGDFYANPHRWIFEAMVKLSERGERIDLVTVARQLQDDQHLDGAGGPVYLAQVIADTPTALHVEHYAGIVRRTAAQRRIIQIGAAITAMAYNNPDTDAVIGQASDMLAAVPRGRGDTTLQPAGIALDELWEFITGEAPDESSRIATGLLDLDYLIGGGFNPGNLIIVAARPGVGKSALAMNIALRAAQRGKGVYFATLEMSAQECAVRLVSASTSIPAARLVPGGLDEEETSRVLNAIGEMLELPIWLDEAPSMRALDLRARVAKLVRDHTINLIVVDYLQLMDGGQVVESNRVAQVSDISRRLKAIAREFGVPVIALSQLSREVVHRNPPRPMLSDLRDSGALEQDADIVMLMHRDDKVYDKVTWEQKFPTETYPLNMADIIVAKQRQGRTGEVRVMFLDDAFRFVSSYGA